MGFLSPYQGVIRVEMGGGYWVDVKRFLSVADSEAAERVIAQTVRSVTGPDGTVRPTFDSVGRTFEQVLASIVDWNLTDENDQPLPLDHDPEVEKATGRPSPRRRSLTRPDFPQVALDKIAAVVSEHNNVDPEAQSSFRGGSPGVSPLGEVEPPDDREVGDRAAVVDAVGGADGPDAVGGTVGAGGGGVPDVDAHDRDVQASEADTGAAATPALT